MDSIYEHRSITSFRIAFIGYTTNKQGNIQSELLQETHDTVMNELKIVKKEQSIAKKQRKDHSEEMAEIKLIIEEDITLKIV